MREEEHGIGSAPFGALFYYLTKKFICGIILVEKLRKGGIKMELLYFLAGFAVALAVGVVVVVLRGGRDEVGLGRTFIEALRGLFDARGVGTLAASRGDEEWYLSLRRYDPPQ
ncbi:MAG: hypothetical protein QXD43_04400 [Candidatus Aenigmatarchaeota archaeon]